MSFDDPADESTNFCLTYFERSQLFYQLLGWSCKKYPSRFLSFEKILKISANWSTCNFQSKSNQLNNSFSLSLSPQSSPVQQTELEKSTPERWVNVVWISSLSGILIIQLSVSVKQQFFNQLRREEKKSYGNTRRKENDFFSSLALIDSMQTVDGCKNKFINERLCIGSLHLYFCLLSMTKLRKSLKFSRWVALMALSTSTL